jgi:hypothetical protein
MKIDSIVPFCSYDKEYINRAIAGVRTVSNNIFVIYSDRLFNGELEDQSVISKVKSDNPDCKFYELKFDNNKSIKKHHNLQRYIGYVMSKSDYLLMVDSDEVFESDKLKQWIENKTEFADVTSFANYWYFRSEKYQATTFEDSPVLVKRDKITNAMLEHELERNIYKYVGLNSDLKVYGLDGNPMCHHYSWALSKEQMLRKVDSWGHKYDRDWKSLVEEEFSREFNGTDFVHGYTYKILEEIAT